MFVYLLFYFQLGCGALVLYGLWLFCYRAFLSPLAKVPGPRLAAFSRGYEMYYDLWQKARFPWKIQDLHARYGSIVRIGPDEVHINDPEYVETEFSSAPSIKHNKYAPHGERFGTPNSTFETIDYDLHKLRRAALGPFFSKRNIVTLEPMIRDKVEQMCSRMREFKASKTPLDLRLLFSCFTTDVITEYAFPRCFDLLSDPDLAPAWRNSFAEGLRNFQWLKHFPSLWHVLRSIPDQLLIKLSPQMRITREWEKGNKKLIKEIVDNFNPSEKRKDSYPTIFHELLASNLPSQEKGYDRLWHEGSAIIGAGVETTSNTLNVILYYLARDPERLHRLKAELEEAMPDPSRLANWQKLEELDYLSAVIHEGLRLGLGIMGRFIRVAPHSTLRYKNYSLPPGTAVSMSLLGIHHHPQLFLDAASFTPERWLEANNRTDLLAFGKGPRMCAGMNLAYAEMYLALAAIVRRFNLTLYETSFDDIEPYCDAFFVMPRETSKGVRVLISD